MHITYYIPFGYLYKTRLRRPVGIIGFFAWEIVPLACTLLLVYHISVLIIGTVFAGYLAFYECGHLWNDRAESASEPGGNRLRVAISLPMFMFIRIAFLILTCTMIYQKRGGPSVGYFAVANGCLFVMFVIHTSRIVRMAPFLRLITFTGLAFYKYVPLLIPLLPWTSVQALLVVVFMTYGFVRVLVYALRKYGSVSVATVAEHSQKSLQLCTCLLFAVLFLNSQDLTTINASGTVVLWLTYTGVTLAWLLVDALRRQPHRRYERVVFRDVEIAK